MLHERQPRDGLGNLHHLVQETQLFDRTKGVRPELDGGFGDGELLGALEKDVVNPGALKTECQHESADTSADDQDFAGGLFTGSKSVDGCDI